MKIELRKVSHYPRLSRETEAFNADVYVNDVKRGTVENEGHGGPNNIDPWELGLEVETYAKTLPPEPPSPGMESYGPFRITGDYLISKILSNHLIEKDIKKAFKTKTLFVTGDGKLYEMRLPHRPTESEARILNDMPLTEAIKLYSSGGK